MLVEYYALLCVTYEYSNFKKSSRMKGKIEFVGPICESTCKFELPFLK